MTRQAPQAPGPGAIPDDPKDPTQRPPPPAGDAESRSIRGQQHTGNHQKPAGESADAHGGTRAGAENVEPAAGRGEDRQSG